MMSIASGKLLKGCGLVGGAFLLIFLASPVQCFRLQNQNHLQSQSQLKSTEPSLNASRAEVVWPPRIPLWGFFPSAAEVAGATHNTFNNNANTDPAKPSKRDTPSSSSLSLKELNEPDLPFSEEEEIDDLEDSWLVNLKRSTTSFGQHPKRTRIYDVPQIECPPAEDGMERFACPTPDKLGRYPCVDDHVLCDGFVDCPGREDEDRQACMFYKTTKAHLDVLADALLRWARGRR